MPKQIIGRVIKPPKGWKFEDGVLLPSEDFNATTFDAVYEWAKAKKYGLKPVLDRQFYDNREFNVTCIYTVWSDSWEVTEKWLGDGQWTLKGTYKASLGTVEMAVAGIAYWNSCNNCRRSGLHTVNVGRPRNLHRLCPECRIPCTNEACEGFTSSTKSYAKERQGECWDCCPRRRCDYCSLWHPVGGMTETKKGYSVCVECVEKCTCKGCGEIFTEGLYKHTDARMLCKGCVYKALDVEREKHETFEEHELPVGGSLQLASLPNRPVRVISIETEVDGDPTLLANTLYNCGIVREGFVESYGTSCPDGANWPAFLKYDGSVSGGELINYLLQLDKPEHAESLKNVLSKLRSLEKLDKVAYHENCGGHIHIDAHNFSSDNVWRLATGYNFLEDVIFRLAGAGSEFGHRTLVDGHDRANGGRGYSHPTAKGPWGVRSGASRALLSQDRMTGLNFVPYFASTNYCRCGSGPDNLRKCKCVLPKCTIEWRVWNSTGNPRILHGWIAFMQALHAWADTPKEMTKDEEDKFPVFAWTRQAWKKTGVEHKRTALERVEWVFTNLVFSETEKDSLSYAFNQTDIDFPGDFWQRVATIPTPKNRAVVKPSNCTIRPKAIQVSPPETPVFGNPRHDPNYVRAAVRRRPRFNAGGIR